MDLSAAASSIGRSIFAFLFMLVLVHPALAECVGDNTGVRICKRCTYQHGLTVKRDTTCDRSYQLAGVDAAIVEARIARQARFGRAGVSGSNYAYAPRKGYVGKDSFVVEWTFIFGGSVHVTYYEMLVDVVP